MVTLGRYFIIVKAMAVYCMVPSDIKPKSLHFRTPILPRKTEMSIYIMYRISIVRDCPHFSPPQKKRTVVSPKPAKQGFHS